MALLAILGGFVGIVAVLVLSSLLRGYTLSVLWGWFVVPIFHLPAISVLQATGIAMVVVYITHTDTSDLQKKEQGTGQTITNAVATAIFYPILVLSFGYVLHRFII